MAGKQPGLMGLIGRIDKAIQSAVNAADPNVPRDSRTRQDPGRPPTRGNIPRVQVSRAGQPPSPPAAPQQPAGIALRPPEALDMPVGEAVPKRRLVPAQGERPRPARPQVVHDHSPIQDRPEWTEEAIATHAAAVAVEAQVQPDPLVEQVAVTVQTAPTEAPAREPFARATPIGQRAQRRTPAVTTAPRPAPIESGQLTPGFVRTGAGFVLPGPPVEVPLPPPPPPSSV